MVAENMKSKVIEIIKNSHQKAVTKYVSEADSQCVINFIKTVWNENVHAKISEYLHDQFIDHSMPYAFLQNKEGLLMYLKAMSTRVSHFTDILELSMIDGFVFCKIRICVAILSENTDTCGNPEIIEGYRLFKMHENRIIAHWEML